MQLGSLNSYLLDKDNEVNGRLATKIGLDTVKGMVNLIEFLEIHFQFKTHLHENNIIHCDLAARNLLIEKEQGLLRVKVTDFGKH